MAQNSSSKRLLVNEAITASEVRLINESGKQVGLVSLEEALDVAHRAELDLVLIVEHSEPPVAKVMDYGRHIFNQKKDKSAAKRKQKQVQIKEIKFRPGTDVGDYNIKLRNLVRFLEAGDKTKITLRFRGREMAHQELGMDMMKRLEADLSIYGTMEMAPKMEGRQLSMVFAPHRKGSAEAARQERARVASEKERLAAGEEDKALKAKATKDEADKKAAEKAVAEKLAAAEKAAAEKKVAKSAKVKTKAKPAAKAKAKSKAKATKKPAAKTKAKRTTGTKKTKSAK